MKRSAFRILFLMFLAPVSAQTGGDNVYEFLNINHSATSAAIGGITVSHSNGDLSIPYFNPALLNSTMYNDISLSFSTYFAGITYGYASYALPVEGLFDFAGGISFINYGRFTEADAAGNITGTFGAAEYAFNLIFSRALDSSFSAGINIKPVFSHLEKYFSFGICADLGMTYTSDKLLLEAGLVIRNAGFQIKSHTGNGGEPLPFEIMAGVTKKLEHAPFRFTLTLRHLEKPDLTYDYDKADEVDQGGLGENILRHMIVGVEVLPFENFWVGAGLNYQRRAELKTVQKTGMAGFTWGFGFNTQPFMFAFGRETFHLAGASNHLTLTLRPDLIFRKGRK